MSDRSTENSNLDNDKMRQAAEKMGFKLIAEHLHHLTIESPQRCRIMNHHYKKIFNCQGKTSEECEKLRDYLVGDCGAERNGNYIGYNWYANSHILEKYMDKKYLFFIQAALHGVSEEECKKMTRKFFWKRIISW